MGSMRAARQRSLHAGSAALPSCGGFARQASGELLPLSPTLVMSRDAFSAVTDERTARHARRLAAAWAWQLRAHGSGSTALACRRVHGARHCPAQAITRWPASAAARNCGALRQQGRHAGACDARAAGVRLSRRFLK